MKRGLFSSIAARAKHTGINLSNNSYSQRCWPDNMGGAIVKLFLSHGGVMRELFSGFAVLVKVQVLYINCYWSAFSVNSSLN